MRPWSIRRGINTSGDATPSQIQTREMQPSAACSRTMYRSPSESIAIEGATLIPLPELAQRYVELPAEQEIVVYCRSGGRSGQAVEFLKSKGYNNVRNLPGGTLRWSDEIDPSMPKY